KEQPHTIALLRQRASFGTVKKSGKQTFRLEKLICRDSCIFENVAVNTAVRRQSSSRRAAITPSLKRSLRKR
ncbi:MAG: hypothetical protein J6A76_00315, partial [Oscillospiraceae bacterium]|nr:hypothetical protein [Oscillospiraceae bacterium]